MEINTLWKIIIKLFGIWFLIDCFSIIPQYTQTFINFSYGIDTETILYVLFFFLANILIYIFIIRLFIFKTDWIINKLKLDKYYSESKIDLNVKTSTVVSIAIIIIGGITLLDAIPRLLSELFEFLQQKTLMKDYAKFSRIILQGLKTIIGYLLVINSKAITEFIQKEVN